MSYRCLASVLLLAAACVVVGVPRSSAQTTSEMTLTDLPTTRDSILRCYQSALVDYPEKARKEAIRTVVWLRITVGEQGKPEKCEVVSCPNPGFGFEEAAIKAAKLSLFWPRWNGPDPVTFVGYFALGFNNPAAPRLTSHIFPPVPRGIGCEAPIMTPDSEVTLVFPPAAAEKLIEADVWLRLLINKRGEVSHAAVERCSVDGYKFGEEAIRATDKMHFPIKKQGSRAMEYRAFTQFRFRLSDDQLAALLLPRYDKPQKVDHLPAPVAKRKAPYPDEAWRAGIVGVVRVRSLVDTSGRVITARIDTSSGNIDLDASALLAAAQYVYSPAEYRGQKVPAWVRYSVSFPSGRDESPREFANEANRIIDSLQKEARRKLKAGETDTSSEEVFNPPPTRGKYTPGMYENIEDPDVLPQFVVYNHARYSDDEIGGGVARGTTKMLALVDTNGVLLEWKVLRSSGNPSLDSSAARAVSGHKFKAGTIGTRRVKAWMTWLVKFEPGSKDVITPDQEKAEKKGLELPEAERVVTPEMPAEAVKKGHTGTVWLQIDVGEDGKVRDAKMIGSSGYAELDSTAMSVATKDSFKPAYYKGKPRAFTMKYKVIFELH
jgi:TonB family protein